MIIVNFAFGDISQVRDKTKLQAKSEIKLNGGKNYIKEEMNCKKKG